MARWCEASHDGMRRRNGLYGVARYETEEAEEGGEQFRGDISFFGQVWLRTLVDKHTGIVEFSIATSICE